METFSALLALCAGNSPVPGEFPAQRPVTRSFDVFFDLRLNKRLSKQSWGWWFKTPSRPLWRHCNDRRLYRTLERLNFYQSLWLLAIHQSVYYTWGTRFWPLLCLLVIKNMAVLGDKVSKADFLQKSVWFVKILNNVGKPVASFSLIAMKTIVI